MTQIVSVPFTNEPGSLAHVLLSLSAAGVDVRTLQTDSLGEVAVARMLVDDPELAVGALREAGHPVQVVPSLQLSAAGARDVGEIARRLGLAGVRVQHTLAAGGVLTLVVDDDERAREALADLVSARAPRLVEEGVASGSWT